MFDNYRTHVGLEKSAGETPLLKTVKNLPVLGEKFEQI
jgi:hypothetical protein